MVHARSKAELLRRVITLEDGETQSSQSTVKTPHRVALLPTANTCTVILTALQAPQPVVMKSPVKTVKSRIMKIVEDTW